ncbi:hypothetical protein HMPREF1218_0601 [Hoylesella pleuritidis F0068]|uniref:Uncharacterized protein n=1 Tax=Hoylesella pleuritidis F0068 TaxID=1081904 RepID=U2L7T7_9BACT|nr:hypothetical protein HMPREF1218_0601 [Hoylesella pleuritidis F0068]
MTSKQGDEGAYPLVHWLTFQLVDLYNDMKKQDKKTPVQPYNPARENTVLRTKNSTLFNVRLIFRND